MSKADKNPNQRPKETALETEVEVAELPAASKPKQK